MIKSILYLNATSIIFSAAAQGWRPISKSVSSGIFVFPSNLFLTNDSLEDDFSYFDKNGS